MHSTLRALQLAQSHHQLTCTPTEHFRPWLVNSEAVQTLLGCVQSRFCPGYPLKGTCSFQNQFSSLEPDAAAGRPTGAVPGFDEQHAHYAWLCWIVLLQMCPHSVSWLLDMAAYLEVQPLQDACCDVRLNSDTPAASILFFKCIPLQLVLFV